MAKGVLNPADKARREARKKELKKNKKQRQQVRSAAIESRNPEQILADLEQLDMKEYSPDKLKRQQQQQEQPSTATSQPVNIDLLYMEKRKRLKELFAKCVAHYEKEDPTKHAKLKSLEVDYEAKHKKILREFEAVKKAAQVNIEEVFLPPEPVASDEPPSGVNVMADPLMSNMIFMTPPPGGSSTVVPHKQQLRPPIAHNPIRGHTPRVATFRGPSGGGALPHDQQTNKRPPRFIPSQARQYPVRQPSQSTTESNTARKPAAGGESQSLLVSKPAAVIESKPVIFMAKATKFVPASVRAKVRPTPSAQSPSDTS